ncbi:MULTISPECIES: hypothetical protein [Vibrio harveyi group]|uniref:Uncharacterized protein n=2 Tax=Vibrio mytili TaxID=50718 RepID=A0A0C3I3B7_9VIBR|nr:hypothetical protein [Vibrio parahaemolyticus]EGR2699426.1 hypothetical protein [Vibrio parahaemolyticus]KIN09540.1 hypothetical protein SU60_18655 [Vibrio mytili]MBA5916483.1 hypothetical protein [Vibrio parahaemolyticus]MBO1659770.1 hypothetical protein [Vibrio parahaemolyticus]
MLNKTKFEKVLSRVINKNSARCSKCKRMFTQPCHTFGGLDAEGKVHNVALCCRDYIVDMRHYGVYTTLPEKCPTIGVHFSVNTAKGERQAKELLDSHPKDASRYSLF